ncbi:unnamed protein product [Eruca vesicaria subsp. sativa]|uniref:Tubulin-specific chaperone A n=1 Tax=Eruca vesicaria subsp. sativa TaxID=29727 RepID=A0ABC8KUM3_ERUVS|nr:unnamed protein product [Eruca vesicaria subsp. sativa]
MFPSGNSCFVQIPVPFKNSRSQEVIMERIRNLKIKTSICKRIVKELHSYEKEVETEAAKTAAMKDNGADQYYQTLIIARCDAPVLQKKIKTWR